MKQDAIIETKHYEWELQRMLAAYQMNLHLDKNSKIKDPKTLIKFSWETDKDKNQIDLSNLDPSYHLKQFM